MTKQAIELKKVITKKELKAFIKFPFGLYKGNPFYVPPIIDFEISTLSPEKNPAFKRDKAVLWLAYLDGKIVGRVAGIIVKPELEQDKKVRFGWIDFIDDMSVSHALLNQVAEWGKAQGANQIHGPMGFTDLDFEGALIVGFDQIATQATIYNHPYYIQHYEKYGLSKAVDWKEIRGKVPESLPPQLTRISNMVKKRFELKVLKFKRSSHIKKFAYEVIELLNKTYNHLYGYQELTEDQINYYVELYFGFIRKEYVNIITNKEGKIVAMAISMPSMSRSFQKANGSLLPFGFIPVLRDFYSNSHLDLFLIAVDPEYQKLGASSIIFDELLSSYIKKGVKTYSTGPMLEDNFGVQNLWDDYKELVETQLRRRCFIKTLE